MRWLVSNVLLEKDCATITWAGVLSCEYSNIMWSHCSRDLMLLVFGSFLLYIRTGFGADDYSQIPLQYPWLPVWSHRRQFVFWAMWVSGWSTCCIPNCMHECWYHVSSEVGSDRPHGPEGVSALVAMIIRNTGNHAPGHQSRVDLPEIIADSSCLGSVSCPRCSEIGPTQTCYCHLQNTSEIKQESGQRWLNCYVQPQVPWISAYVTSYVWMRLIVESWQFVVTLGPLIIPFKDGFEYRALAQLQQKESTIINFM